MNVPARVRYTALNQHTFLRGGSTEYPELCGQLIELPEFSGAEYSKGDQRYSLVANGHVAPGNQSNWITNDTNHHMEYVSKQVWGVIEQHDQFGLYDLREPSRDPWLQRELV